MQFHKLKNDYVRIEISEKKSNESTNLYCHSFRNNALWSRNKSNQITHL